MNTTKAPEIRLVLSLDGTVKELDVVADTPEDRDRALVRLHQFLPGIELLESLVIDPPHEAPDGRGSNRNTTAVGG